jgi:hypothetical protein
MAAPYTTASDLRNMGHQSREDRVDAAYSIIKTKMLNQAQIGNLFVEIQICGHDWSIVNDLCRKIQTEHPDVVIRNDRSYIHGYPSTIVVRWDN